MKSHPPTPLLSSTPAPPAASFDLPPMLSSAHAAPPRGGSVHSEGGAGYAGTTGDASYAYQQQLALQRIRASTSSELPRGAQGRGSQAGRGSQGSSPPSSTTSGTSGAGEDDTLPRQHVATGSLPATPGGLSGTGSGGSGGEGRDSVRSSATTVPRHGKAPPRMVGRDVAMAVGGKGEVDEYRAQYEAHARMMLMGGGEKKGDHASMSPRLEDDGRSRSPRSSEDASDDASDKDGASSTGNPRMCAPCTPRPAPQSPPLCLTDGGDD